MVTARPGGQDGISLSVPSVMLGQDVRAEVSGWEVRREGESWYGWSARRNAQPVGTARGVERAAARARRGLPRAGARPGSVPGSGRWRRLRSGDRPARFWLPRRPPDRPRGRQGGDIEDGQGISVASRWPLGEVWEPDLNVTPRTEDFACGTIIVEVFAPEPVGLLLFVNHLPNWQLTFEHERELQTVVVGRAIEKIAESRDLHVVLAGDLDATPDAASVRFWRGRQSLGGMSVCYRDAWGSTHPDEPGHTFTAENPLVTAENWDWELGRRIDHVFVHCTDHGPTLDIRNRERIFDEPVDGVWGNDHFGVVADLSTQTSSGRPVR